MDNTAANPTRNTLIKYRSHGARLGHSSGLRGQPAEKAVSGRLMLRITPTVHAAAIKAAAIAVKV
jgi:hypothetical protein